MAGPDEGKQEDIATPWSPPNCLPETVVSGVASALFPFQLTVDESVMWQPDAVFDRSDLP